MSHICVDLDGTLARYDGFKGSGHIGDPVPAMLERVKRWLAEGREVRIFTARVGASGKLNKDGTPDDDRFADEARKHIQAWCIKHIGIALPVTASKDFETIAIWDDRAVNVQANTGEPCCKFWSHVA